MNMKYLLALSVAVLACTSESGDRAPRTDEQPPGPAAETVVADTTASWTVRPTGARNTRIGMTFSQLAPYMNAPGDTTKIGDGCGYVSVTGAPDSVRFMVEGRHLVRIDVAGGRTSTAEGARIGDSERRVQELYPGARRTPHKYTSGNYLVVIPGAPSDTLHRYVFETDGARVTQYRAGVFPQVEWVEGCS